MNNTKWKNVLNNNHESRFSKLAGLLKTYPAMIVFALSTLWAQSNEKNEWWNNTEKHVQENSVIPSNWEPFSSRFYDFEDWEKILVWDINENNKLDVEEIETILLKDVDWLKKNTDLSDKEIYRVKEKFTKLFDQAKMINMKPSIWQNQKALTNKEFIDQLNDIWKVVIDWEEYDFSDVDDAYLWVKMLLKMLWYTWVDWEELDLTNGSSNLSKILREQSDLYVALLKYQNNNNSSYFSQGVCNADGIVWWYTIRWLLLDWLKTIILVWMSENPEKVEKNYNDMLEEDKQNEDIQEKKQQYDWQEENKSPEWDIYSVDEDSLKDVSNNVKDNNQKFGNLQGKNEKFDNLEDIYKDFEWETNPMRSDVFVGWSSGEDFINKNDLKEWKIKNPEYVNLMYNSIWIDTALISLSYLYPFKEFTGFWIKQLDSSITNLKNGIEIRWKNGEEIVIWKMPEDMIEVENLDDGGIRIKFLPKGIERMFQFYYVDPITWDSSLWSTSDYYWRFDIVLMADDKKYDLKFNMRDMMYDEHWRLKHWVMQKIYANSNYLWQFLEDGDYGIKTQWLNYVWLNLWIGDFFYNVFGDIPEFDVSFYKPEKEQFQEKQLVVQEVEDEKTTEEIREENIKILENEFQKAREKNPEIKSFDIDVAEVMSNIRNFFDLTWKTQIDFDDPEVRNKISHLESEKYQEIIKKEVEYKTMLYFEDSPKEVTKILAKKSIVELFVLFRWAEEVNSSKRVDDIRAFVLWQYSN